MTEDEFRPIFAALAGTPGHFPWQWELYKRFIAGEFPSSCNLPTGLGKTSVIHLWLLALATCPDKVPRRLVYVVNRRTVVDQSTDEAVRMRDRLRDAPELAGVTTQLRHLCAFDDPEQVPLAISTLRGQFADNREWSTDPARPAVICGTVDMIGSRLLFSGYGCGYKTRPLHAGFLGQDALLVHDEAHLEPAFQTLLGAIRDEQGREPAPLRERMRLKVMELTATSRSGTEAFPNDEERKANEAHPLVQQRVHAKKALHLVENKDEKRLAEQIAGTAAECGIRHPGSAIVVFVRHVETVGKITKKLPAGSFETLTGTLRGYERDRLVKKPIFQRFLPPSNRDKDITPAEGTAYLVCTSAGEVGVNISADHLVCDLSTFESMAQRFGRVNRFGTCPDTEIHVVHPRELELPSDEAEAAERKKKKPNPQVFVDGARRRTLRLLSLANGDGSPATLRELHQKAMQEGSGAGPMSTGRTQALRDYVLATYAPQPKTLPTSDILFDAWALTTVRDLPGRPAVAEYLHGVEDEQRAETSVAWREEVWLFRGTEPDESLLTDLLDGHPLKPHEVLRDSTFRKATGVRDQLAKIAARAGDLPAWVQEPAGRVRPTTLRELPTLPLVGRTVILPPHAGGLLIADRKSVGTLDGSAEYDEVSRSLYDVAGGVRLAAGHPLVRLTIALTEGLLTYRPLAPVVGLPPDFHFTVSQDEKGEGEKRHLRDDFVGASFPPLRVALRLDTRSGDEPTEGTVEYLVLKREAVKGSAKYTPAWPSLGEHLKGVAECAGAICTRLHLPADIIAAVTLAGEWHDLGKDRAVWQRGAGNRPGTKAIAKTLHGRPPESLNGFRHELGSLMDVYSEPAIQAAFQQQSLPSRALLLHLIATHHGRARPHFPAREAIDPERPEGVVTSIASEAPARFARLQREYGRWGLAYLESVLRAADARDSQRLEQTPVGSPEAGTWPRPSPPFAACPASRGPVPTIRVKLNPHNPGQFFACCGLFEVAGRLWSGAEGWFAEDAFVIAPPRGEGTLQGLLRAAKEMQLAGGTAAADDEADEESTEDSDDADDTFEPLEIVSPFQLRLDWWQDKALKTWAGRMDARRIFRALCNSIDADGTDPMNQEQVVYDPEQPPVEGTRKAKKPKKCEPYYFDGRRGVCARALDIGFMPDALKTTKMTTKAFPIVEALCFIGLQRCRPVPTETPRVLDYWTWGMPLPVSIAPAAVAGFVAGKGRFRFENIFRTGQRKHKAFTPATLIGGPR